MTDLGILLAAPLWLSSGSKGVQTTWYVPPISKESTANKNVNTIGIAIGILIVLLLIILALFITIIAFYNIIHILSRDKLFLENYTNSSTGLIFDYIIIGLLPLLAFVVYKMS